jgi:hypothetical protein
LAILEPSSSQSISAFEKAGITGMSLRAQPHQLYTASSSLESSPGLLCLWGVPFAQFSALLSPYLCPSSPRPVPYCQLPRDACPDPPPAARTPPLLLPPCLGDTLPSGWRFLDWLSVRVLGVSAWPP